MRSKIEELSTQNREKDSKIQHLTFSVEQAQDFKENMIKTEQSISEKMRSDFDNERQQFEKKIRQLQTMINDKKYTIPTSQAD